MNDRDLLTVGEVADYLRITKGTVWRWCRIGKLPAIKIGHQWRIRREGLEEMIRPSLPPNDGAIGDQEALAVPLTVGHEFERGDGGDGTA